METNEMNATPEEKNVCEKCGSKIARNVSERQRQTAQDEDNKLRRYNASLTERQLAWLNITKEQAGGDVAKRLRQVIDQQIWLEQKRTKEGILGEAIKKYVREVLVEFANSIIENTQNEEHILHLQLKVLTEQTTKMLTELDEKNNQERIAAEEILQQAKEERTQLQREVAIIRENFSNLVARLRQEGLLS